MFDLISRQVVIDLIDAELAGETNQDIVFGLNRARDLVSVEPAIKPKIVANISGGVLQGASSDYLVDIHALDFDTDTFDAEATGILVEDDMAYVGQVSAKFDPDFVESVVNAPERFIHNKALVCGQCQGTGRTQSMSNLEDEVCPVCDGSGELPE